MNSRGPTRGTCCLVVIRHLDSLSDDQVAGLDLPTGIPLAYELEPDMLPVIRGGQNLDPEAARESIEAVRNQGRRAPAQAAGQEKPGDERRARQSAG